MLRGLDQGIYSYLGFRVSRGGVQVQGLKLGGGVQVQWQEVLLLLHGKQDYMLCVVKTINVIQIFNILFFVCFCRCLVFNVLLLIHHHVVVVTLCSSCYFEVSHLMCWCYYLRFIVLLQSFSSCCCCYFVFIVLLILPEVQCIVVVKHSSCSYCCQTFVSTYYK